MLLFVLTSIFFTTAFSQENPVEFDRAILVANRIIQKVVAGATIPGAGVAVSVKNQVVWTGNYGVASIELSAPVTGETKFRIASISKLLTGTAVALLVEQGRLDPDRPISEYLDDLPESWRRITTRQLVHHTSGIGHYLSPEDALEVIHYSTTAAALAKFKDRPLLFTPGEQEHYSSFAYTVIAAVIEAASGKDFLTFMEEEIFAPLGMNSTVADAQADIIPERTGFYQLDPDGQVQNAPYIDLSGRWAGSGFLSTATDLARFGAAHTGPGFLSQETLNLLSTPMMLPDGTQTKEGFGWGPRRGWEGRPMIWGDGSTPGARGGLLVYPEQDVTVAWLSNLRSANLMRGELQIVALPFLAAVEGRTMEPAGESYWGEYNLKLQVGGEDGTGRLELFEEDGRATGSFKVRGWHTFEVIDAFLIGPASGEKDSVLWVLTYAPTVGILPMRLTTTHEGLAGEVFRAGIKVEATKITEESPRSH